MAGASCLELGLRVKRTDFHGTVVKRGPNMWLYVVSVAPQLPPARYPGAVPSLLYVTNATTNISDSQQRLLPPADALVAIASSGGDSGVSVLSPRGRCGRGAV